MLYFKEYYKERKNRIALALFIALCIVASSINVLKPLYSGSFIDSISEKEEMTIIVKNALILSVVLLFGLGLNVILKICAIRIKNDLSFRGKNSIISHLQDACLMKVETLESGYLYSRTTRDVDLIVEFFFDNVASVILQGLTGIITLIILLLMDCLIFLCVVFSLTAYIVLYIALKGGLYKRSFDFREQTSLFSAILIRRFKDFRVNKVISNYKRINQHMDRNYNAYLKKCMSYTHYSEFFKSVEGIVSILFQIVTMIIGALEIVNGRMTLGQFIVLTAYFSNLLAAIKYYADFAKRFQEIKTAKERLKEIIDIPVETKGEKKIKHVNSIELRDVTFRYEKPEYYLGKLNVVLQRGKSYCLYGPNGSGKTTLCELLIGLLMPTGGHIMYNGENYSSINMMHVREKLAAYMSQDRNDSNITVKEYMEYYYGISNIEELNKNELYKQMFRIYHTDTFVIEKVLDEKINSLSGGEWQKIELLCVISKNPELLILDEPTSAWDLFSSELFNKSIHLIAKKRILIIVSHNSELASSCDCIINLQNNAIEEILDS